MFADGETGSDGAEQYEDDVERKSDRYSEYKDELDSEHLLEGTAQATTEEGPFVGSAPQRACRCVQEGLD